jgi:exodeoxyribonuclease VII large subunit
VSLKPLTPQPSAEKDIFARKVYSVSELTRLIKRSLQNQFGYVWVTGEITDLRPSQRRHFYFKLKDECAQIQVVLFYGRARHLKFELENGLELLVWGLLSVYEPRGEYQLVAQYVEPRGRGALQVAFEQLKRKLDAEGLFDTDRKKPIPAFPWRVGIVTSPVGAAIKDMLNIITRRFPHYHLIITPVKVQGEGAAEEIAAAIALLNRFQPRPDVIIVGRGGGSIEDLWAFNEEVVARAIFASEIPVISAVGHEIDVTISDMVADRRALTPSEAAELITPDEGELMETLAGYGVRLAQALQGSLRTLRTRLDSYTRSYALRRPRELLFADQQRVDELTSRLTNAMISILRHRHEQLLQLGHRLEAVSPLAVLARGYSLTLDAKTRKVITQAEELTPGQVIETVLRRGRVRSEVKRIWKQDRRRK